MNLYAIVRGIGFASPEDLQEDAVRPVEELVPVAGPVPVPSAESASAVHSCAPVVSPWVAKWTAAVRNP